MYGKLLALVAKGASFAVELFLLPVLATSSQLMAPYKSDRVFVISFINPPLLFPPLELPLASIELATVDVIKESLVAVDASDWLLIDVAFVVSSSFSISSTACSRRVRDDLSFSALISVDSEEESTAVGFWGVPLAWNGELLPDITCCGDVPDLKH